MSNCMLDILFLFLFLCFSLIFRLLLRARGIYLFIHLFIFKKKIVGDWRSYIIIVISTRIISCFIIINIIIIFFFYCSHYYYFLSLSLLFLLSLLFIYIMLLLCHFIFILYKSFIYKKNKKIKTFKSRRGESVDRMKKKKKKKRYFMEKLKVTKDIWEASRIGEWMLFIWEAIFLWVFWVHIRMCITS